MSDLRAALTVLEATSRTFFIPIAELPDELKEAVMSGYLCLRAIDEIEDHPNLPVESKVRLLREISRVLQSDASGVEVETLLRAEPDLPEVTVRLHEWTSLAPDEIGPRVCDATAAMADRMATWAERGWTIRTEADLNWYTFSVAGAVGLLLADLWAWYDGTTTSRVEAKGFGRCLQATNILLNRAADLDRGVDFFPDCWSGKDMYHYAERNLRLADAYVRNLPDGPARVFCRLVVALVRASLQAWLDGERKLTRAEVGDVVRACASA